MQNSSTAKEKTLEKKIAVLEGKLKKAENMRKIE